MSLLYFFEQIRNPVLDFFMLTITHLGEEMLFVGLAVLFLWCIDKYEGYYLLSVGFLGGQINQLLKVIFRVPRPWVLDKNFTAVEKAIPGAAGYSFPSGHTQSAVGVYGGIARWTGRRFLRWVCIAIAVIVPLSRMYLGVHTPLDVGVSVLLALVLIFVFHPLFSKREQNDKWIRLFFWGLFIWSALQLLFMEFFPFPADADGAELYSALEAAYKMGGAMLGFVLSYEIDRRWIHYRTEGVWWSQVLKLVLGLGLTLGIKELVYLLPGGLPVKGLAYCLMVLFIGAGWPLTFPWFAKLGKK